MKDTLFNTPIKSQFDFNEQVASVFDDMLERSVPFYKEALSLSVYFVLQNTEKNDLVYDLGCSTGSFLLELERNSEHSLELIGLDSATAMIDQATKKIIAFNSNVKVEVADMLQYDFKKSKAFVSSYTLQFIRPPVRIELVKKIYESLEEGGVFIFSEKIISTDKKLNKEMIDKYYTFKKEQGYSEYEIAQKREALENVLVPYTEQENIDMVLESGFSHVQTIFKWMNFTTFIAVK